MIDDVPPDRPPPVVTPVEHPTSRKLRRRSRRQRGLGRSFSVSNKVSGPHAMERLGIRATATNIELAENAADRPRTRAECIDGIRPCPWVSCKHHLYLEVNPNTGSIKINFPDLEPWELGATCSLDIAESGTRTLEEVGEITNLTRERVRQLEVKGFFALRERAIAAGMSTEDFAGFAQSREVALPDGGSRRVDAEAEAAPIVVTDEAEVL